MGVEISVKNHELAAYMAKELMEDKLLVVIVGPTAVGKTALCVTLAQLFGTEIISADSRQFFKEMAIGTAKPTVEEMDGVVHHFVDHMSVDTPYSAGRFELDALAKAKTLFATHDTVIATGGSTLYIKGLVEGFDDMPKTPEAVRAQVIADYEEKGLEFLVKELWANDPAYADEVDLQNPQRVMRAVEVFRVSGQPMSFYRKNKLDARPFKMLKIGLEREREELYDRINRRVDIMIEQGLFEEVERLLPYREVNALQTVGYKEVFDYMDGQYDREEAIRLLKRNTRRYAKRQLTYFKKDEEFHWFHPEDEAGIVALIREHLKGEVKE
ncbi:tRNA dimethylallyltransferase 1 [Persicobacter psychrovividus]|uniref:tRNA dimethylallyltransferase n=2 Tax=Persicobacter psychrovividus TaxID=387638 RepID=A0ABN6L8Q9_9BACT|nr:tRNA dimethylallyltransferase 1 [Persicobacter psychrovividus]